MSNKTKEVRERNGAFIFHLKQNMFDDSLLNVQPRKGDTQKIRCAELFLSEGSFYTQNYRSAQSTNYKFISEFHLL